MWDLFVMLDGELMRLGMSEDGELSGPTLRRELGVKATHIEHLAGPRALVVHSEEASFLVSEDLQRVRELPPLICASPDGTLGFAFDGHRLAKDLVVAPLTGGHPFVVADVGWLPNLGHCFVPKLDVVVLVVADANSETGRNLAVIPLKQLRDWAEQGVTRANFADLDYDNLIGIRMDFPQDLPIGVCTIQDHPGFFAFWHSRPKAKGAAEATLLEIEYPYWTDSQNARTQVRLLSKPVVLDRFWCSQVEVRPMKSGGRVVQAIGTGRKANDFVLGVRQFTLHEPDADLRTALTGARFVDLRSSHIELRHAGGVDGIFALPNGRGYLVRIEDPNRKFQLFRVDIGPSRFAEMLIDFDATPDAYCLVAPDEEAQMRLAAEVRPALKPAFGGEVAKISLKSSKAAAEPEAAPEPEPIDLFGDGGGAGGGVSNNEADDVVEVEFSDFDDVSVVEIVEVTEVVEVVAAAKSGDTAGAAKAGSSADVGGASRGAQPGWTVVWSGTLPVVPGSGLDLPIGMLPADAIVVASVVGIGDAKGAELQHWLSQSQPQGDALFTLHLRAATMVQARCAVYRVAV